MTKSESLSILESVFKGEEGYLEKASSANLDSKTANAGYNNYTKYWRDIADWGLGNYQAQYWCAGFVHWCFVTAFGLAKAKSLLLHAPYISCATLASKSNSVNQRYIAPNVGDVVIYWNGSRFYHTGYVIAVTSTTYTTIEGNTSGGTGIDPNGGGVFKKVHSIAEAKAKGHKFHRPDYANILSSTSSGNSNTVTNTTNSKSTNVSIGQKWLNDNYKNALKDFCGALLEVDGQYGTKSRNGALAVFKDLLNRKYGQKLDPKNTNFGTDTKKAAQQAIVQLNSSGTFTYIAQFILSAKGHYKGSMDAAAGAETISAIKAFQKEKGLSQDGACGKDTWYALFN